MWPAGSDFNASALDERKAAIEEQATTLTSKRTFFYKPEILGQYLNRFDGTKAAKPLLTLRSVRYHRVGALT